MRTEDSPTVKNELSKLISHSTPSIKQLLLYQPPDKKVSADKMCEGTVTIMNCGCALIHYTSYCHHAATHRELRPCPQDKVHGPLQHIDDSCAACHPSFKIFEINQRHDEFRDRKMVLMRKA